MRLKCKCTRCGKAYYINVANRWTSINCRCSNCGRTWTIYNRRVGDDEGEEARIARDNAARREKARYRKRNGGFIRNLFRSIFKI